MQWLGQRRMCFEGKGKPYACALALLRESPKYMRSGSTSSLSPTWKTWEGRREKQKVRAQCALDSYPGGQITNWFSGFRNTQMCMNEKNIGLLAHHPRDTRGRLQHKAKIILLPLSTLSSIGLLIDKGLWQRMGKSRRIMDEPRQVGWAEVVSQRPQ